MTDEQIVRLSCALLCEALDALRPASAKPIERSLVLARVAEASGVPMPWNDEDWMGNHLVSPAVRVKQAAAPVTQMSGVIPQAPPQTIPGPGRPAQDRS